MPYQTDERLKSYLDTNQLHREQMCRAILSIDKRFTDVHPRHPRGGRDAGRDIEAIYRKGQLAYGAVGFVNQANDSDKQKKAVKAKFQKDLERAVDASPKPKAFVFFTNINLTIGEKDDLISKAKHAGLLFSEILDRERLRIVLDSPDGFSIRFQYLNISLSEEEQASFFARWGDDIQSIISTGFQRIENTLNRILFLQEATDRLVHLTFAFELNRKYQAEEIGHFRLFCSMLLKKPKHDILSILFGSSDKSNRMRFDMQEKFTDQSPGIKFGISGGQWEQHIDQDEPDNNECVNDEEEEKYVCVGSSSHIGMDEVEFIRISYTKDSFVLLLPCLTLRDIDESMYVLLANRSLAEKIKAIHIYANGYKIQEISRSEISIAELETRPNFPVNFSDEELSDTWISLGPQKASGFQISFFDETPKRMFVPNQTTNSIEHRNE